jgi:hypothetical protein
MIPNYQVGDKVSKLTVIGNKIIKQPSGRNRNYYVCKCDCGSDKLVNVEGYNLKNGRYKSCGCLRKRANGLSHTIEYRIWKSAKDRAEKKGWEFNIEISDIQIPKICPLLEIPLTLHGKKNRHFDAPSLDRIDSSKGYTVDNVWIISHRANQLKNDATINEIKLIAKNLCEKILKVF